MPVMTSTTISRRAPLALGIACVLAAALGLGAGACRGAGSPGPRAEARDAAAAPALPPADPSFGPAAIDAAVRAAWQEAGITPAGRVDDAGFLRRAWLDIAGTLPPPEVVAAFLADAAPDKRARAVDALLESPRYADRWTDAWYDILMGPVRSPAVDHGAFRRWLHAQFAANTPWDKLAYSLLTATGRNSVGGARKGQEGPAVDPEVEREEGVNGAVNWHLKYARSQLDLPATASRVFLGVQIQCAQCHDHKTERWTQADFRGFAASFAHVRARPVGEQKKGGVRTFEVVDGARPRRAGRRSPDREELQAVAAAAPRALDGADLAGSDNRREALASWMVSPRNPWFAKAIVNRMWAALIGRGFVDPVDDLRPGNPGSLPALHQRLADDFIAHHHDLKHLIRTITATEVYQRAAAPAQTGDGKPADDALWPRYRVRPLPPPVLLDAMIAATGLDPVLERVAGERREQLEAQLRRGFGFLFEVDEEADADGDHEGTIPQALFLLNGALGAAGASAAIPGAALGEVLAGPGTDAQRIEALYLRALSRRPTDAEIERWVRFVNEPREAVRTDPPAAPEAGAGRGKKRGPGQVELPPRLARRLQARPGTAREQAYEDLLWALLNSSEFFFNH